MKKFSTLYMFNLDGKIYWGSYGKASYMGLHSDWLMRGTPMKEKTWYGNALHQVSFESFIGQGGDRQFLVSHRCIHGVTHSVIRRCEPRMVICGNNIATITIASVRQSRSMVACLRNCLRDYAHNYLFPLSRRNRRVRDYYGLTHWGN